MRATHPATASYECGRCGYAVEVRASPDVLPRALIDVVEGHERAHAAADAVPLPDAHASLCRARGTPPASRRPPQ